MRSQSLLLLAIAGLSAGCGWFKSPTKENVEPPAELTEFAASANVQKLWSYQVGDGGGKAGLRLAPTHADGRIYAASIDGVFVAINADSGKALWREESERRYSGGPGVGQGIAVAGTLDGDVIALDSEDGKELWSAKVSSEVIATPAVAAEAVVVRAHDGRVYCLSSKDGKRLWVYDAAVPLLSLRGNGSPLIVGDVVYVGYDNGKVVALKLDSGSLVWEQRVASADGRTELERLVDVDGALQWLGGDLFAVSYRGQLAAMTADSGRQLWVREMSSYDGLVVSGEQIFLSDSDGNVWALDKRSGSSVWKQDVLAHRVLTAPVLQSGHVVVGDLEGYLHWMSIEDGSLAARQRLGKKGIVAAPISVGDVVYAEAVQGELAAYRLAKP